MQSLWLNTLHNLYVFSAVTQMEQIKRANKLFSNDCIFLRHSLNIPVVSEKRFIFNGLSLESPDGDSETSCQEADTPCVVTQDIEGPSPPSSPPPEESKPPQPEELSAKDFLHRLDLQIKQSKQAARRLKEEEVRWGVLMRAQAFQTRQWKLTVSWSGHVFSLDSYMLSMVFLGLIVVSHYRNLTLAPIRWCRWGKTTLLDTWKWGPRKSIHLDFNYVVCFI